jgi:CBS domain-containing protein
MRVQDVMTANALKYCTPETNLHQAAKSMREANCGALPVVDRNKKVLGIITDRDICLSLAQHTNKAIDVRTVGEIMSRDVRTIRATEDVSEAYRKMRERKIGRLPVVDEQGNLKGILSLNRLVKHSVARGREAIGDVHDTGENLAKTLQAISNRREAKLPASF